MRSLKCGTNDGVKYFSYKRESVTWQQIISDGTLTITTWNNTGEKMLNMKHK